MIILSLDAVGGRDLAYMETLPNFGSFFKRAAGCGEVRRAAPGLPHATASSPVSRMDRVTFISKKYAYKGTQFNRQIIIREGGIVRTERCLRPLGKSRRSAGGSGCAAAGARYAARVKIRRMNWDFLKYFPNFASRFAASDV